MVYWKIKRFLREMHSEGGGGRPLIDSTVQFLPIKILFERSRYIGARQTRVAE